jgi:hypothetical protein
MSQSITITEELLNAVAAALPSIDKTDLAGLPAY